MAQLRHDEPVTTWIVGEGSVTVRLIRPVSVPEFAIDVTSPQPGTPMHGPVPQILGTLPVIMKS